MKILIITQAIDSQDSVMGFFHRWAEEFSRHYDKVTIICLGKGVFNLPTNVKVLSLGKEVGAPRFSLVRNFYWYVWSERKNYDNVFVHMNQEYILLGGLIWRLLGKKIYLWRNHLKGNFLTKLAVLMSNKVFCTSPQSFTAQFKKTKLMPVGIDTRFFRPGFSTSKKSNSILFLGRIAPVKNILVFIESLNELQKLGVDFCVTIAGSSLPKDKDYENIIKKKVDEYELKSRVKFVGSVNQNEALALYQEHALYLNLTPSGSMDKTIFEAMSCGVTPLVYNEDLVEVLGEEYLVRDLDSKKVAEDIKRAMSGNKRDFRAYVVENHSLELLAKKLFKE